MLTIPQPNRFYYLILILLTLLVYANSFQNAFQYDDFHVIVSNPSIKDSKGFLEFFLNPQLGSGLIKETSGYRPLLMTTFALNYLVGGLDVLSFHLLNFFLHVFCSILVFSLTIFFLQIAYGEKEGSRIRFKLTALFAALIFAAHPVQTEAVTYITGRSSSLTALFFLAAFWTYMLYGLSGKIYLLFLSSLSFSCALLVKESAITLILVLILYNVFFPLGRTWKRRFFSLVPHFILSVVYLILRIFLFGSLQYSSDPLRPIYDNILTQLKAWVYALGTLVLPLNLNVDYDISISHSILEGQVLLAIFILGGIVLIIWWIAQSFRPVGFFALWFAINLAPTSSIIPLEDVLTDRWLYLPAVGFAIILAFGAEWIFRAKIAGSPRVTKWVFFFLCSLLVEFYGFETMLRNLTWRSYWTLWEDAVEKSPNKGRPHVALGLALNAAGYPEEAIQEFKKAVRLNPQAGEAYLNIGHIYFVQEKYAEAIQFFKKAITLRPRLAPVAHNNLGALYLKIGQKEEGIKELQQALKARPVYARPYFNFGLYYDQEGNIDKAITSMEKAIQIEPEFIPAHSALIQLYAKKGMKEKSQDAYKNFLKQAARGKSYLLGE